MMNHKVQVLYGVSDGSTYSHAFFNRAGAQNWVTLNPYNDNKPIWWLSDYPIMIKKLRNFIVNPDGNLQFGDSKICLAHLIGVVERRTTKLKWKHLKLTPGTKISVKRAVTLCSLDAALDILKGFSPAEETVLIRTYIIHCYKIFKLFNSSTGVDPDSYKQLLKIMLWFDKWYNEIKNEIKLKRGKGGSKEIWKKFISRITYKDLKRSIMAFLGVIQYVQMNFPHLHIIPKTMCQDDVENYVSLQRAKVPGGKPTTVQYFEYSASLNKHMLINERP